jgi:uncharacterized protein (TIGR02996 family)
MMTPQEAFLKAIQEQPEDDGPRLMYADWLEERGDPRGEFIRVQCQPRTRRWLGRLARLWERDAICTRNTGLAGRGRWRTWVEGALTIRLGLLRLEARGGGGGGQNRPRACWRRSKTTPPTRTFTTSWLACFTRS